MCAYMVYACLNVYGHTLRVGGACVQVEVRVWNPVSSLLSTLYCEARSLIEQKVHQFSYPT